MRQHSCVLTSLQVDGLFALLRFLRNFSLMPQAFHLSGSSPIQKLQPTFRRWTWTFPPLQVRRPCLKQKQNFRYLVMSWKTDPSFDQASATASRASLFVFPESAWDRVAVHIGFSRSLHIMHSKHVSAFQSACMSKM